MIRSDAPSQHHEARIGQYLYLRRDRHRRYRRHRPLQPADRQAADGQQWLGRHRRAAEAPRRSHPAAGTTVQAYAAHERQLFEDVAEKRNAALAAGDDAAAARRSRERALQAGRPADRAGRSLSRSQGQSELPRSAEGALGHRKQDRNGAPLLQRRRARAEHGGRELSLQPRRRRLRRRQARLLRDRHRRSRRATGQCGRPP